MAAKKNVLLVDDQKTIEMSVRIIFQREPYNLFYSSSVPKGLQVLESRSDIDLVLLDLSLPEISGYEFLDILKNRANRPPVIVVSHINTAAHGAKAIKAGAVDYVTKPIDGHDLLGKMKRVFGE